MEHLSAWLGAGVVTAGVSAALLAGAGVACADTDSGSDGGGTSTSDSSKPAASAADSTTPDKPDSTPSKPASSVGETESTQDDADEVESPASTGEDADDADDAEPAAKPVKRGTTKKKPADVDSAAATVAKPAGTPEPATSEAAEAAEPTEVAPEAPAVIEAAASDVAANTKAAPTASLVSARALMAPAVAPPAPSLLGIVGSVIASVVVNVGSIALTALQAVEALASGPPVLPPGSTVTVRDSWITLGNGQRIAANWYYPEGDTPPDRLVVLQHGFLALGPMYSYTAANLAERTHSIVVTPTIPSNLFLGDDHWLGGAGMASEIADLFVGDRTALTRSALDAGFATRYGLDPVTAKLPQKFALMGHSLGGNLVPAAAGFLTLNGGAADLVGVITLDGVPLPGTIETALARLADYEAATDHYIPIREIGAPRNLYNSTSTINEALSSARPDHFNGVVLTDGVHMDSMRGGNPLIQFAAYVAAGFPTPQNPPAVEELAARWLDEWFGGDPFVGDDVLIPGSTFDIPTPKGTAEATVIGSPLARRSLVGPFAAHAPTDIPPADALLTALAV
ncbi:alpha/beta hydrolase [Mycolicibacterium arenosum]|uniref:Alpha/beta hydrolase n=1 Tax=Mycolicibacterium arenosum TaxID=2952157 RepID=A0ABT1M9P3_9MYCO|nr:alpha/beta hydrolase [Mycolicibacterium sp. CAU 1645]MCP9275890.1 alpha/beta hydrolase [Mycolicibacterium sp. CAU 1645]